MIKLEMFIVHNPILTERDMILLLEIANIKIIQGPINHRIKHIKIFIKTFIKIFIRINIRIAIKIKIKIKVIIKQIFIKTAQEKDLNFTTIENLQAIHLDIQNGQAKIFKRNPISKLMNK